MMRMIRMMVTPRGLQHPQGRPGVALSTNWPSPAGYEPFDGVRQTRPKQVQAQKKAAKVGQSQTDVMMS